MISKNIVYLGVTLVFVTLSVLELTLASKNQVWENPLSSVETPIIASEANLEAQAVVSSSVTVADARPILIQRYLKRYNSPLLPYAELIFSRSETYDLDYRLILAIGQQESNLCKKIPEGSHNCWGYGIHKKGSLGFDSYELSLKSYAAYLKREYFDKGYDTIEKIEKKYNPNSNGSWAYGVNFFMRQIEKGDF